MIRLTIVSEGYIFLVLLIFVGFAMGCGQDKTNGKINTVKDKTGLHSFMVLDPGHFHAALAFKRSGYATVSPVVSIYAPVGNDYTDHMNRVIPFNTRKENPAQWRYRTYLGPDFLEVLTREKPGDIVLISGSNNKKIDRILACINAGLNVLADKPWIIEPGKFQLLESIFTEAEKKGLIAYDMMTERFEITSILQRLIVAHEPVFGNLISGTPDNPAVVKSSVHHLSKMVAGRQLKRPWWFFDTSIQGEGLVDITTHLVDLMFRTLYPEEAIDYKQDIEMDSASRWPTILSADQYGTITGQEGFPPQFNLDDNNNYPYYCNGRIKFRLKGINIQVEVVWNYKAPEGTGDTHYSIIKGTRAHILVLQGPEQNYSPELYIEPAPGADSEETDAALKSFIASLAQNKYPGLTVHDEKDRWRIDIPQEYRVGHEAHFGQVVDRFLAYLDGEPIPSWERANMLAKYYITTKALEICRRNDINQK